MNKSIKVIFVSAVLGTSLLFGGCSQSAEDMADEMCECLKNNGARGCDSLWQEHEESIGDDSEKMADYQKQIFKCK